MTFNINDLIKKTLNIGGNKMSLKSKIYKILRIWNDIDAVRKGRIGRRIGRRVTGRVTGRLIRRLFK